MGNDATLQTVAIGRVKPGDNIRADVGDLEDLAASIRAVGILEPIVATKNGAGFTVVAGHRRLAAAKLAGLKEVPLVVRDALDVRERVEVMLIENLQREDLSPTDEASAYRKLIDDHGYDQKRLAERIGRSQGHVSKRLALLTLTPKARSAIDAGALTLEDAGHLVKLAEHPKRVDALVDHAGDRGVGEFEVRMQLEEIAAEKRKTDALAQAAKDGTRVVKFEGPEWNRKLKGVSVLVTTDGYYHDAHVRMDPKVHAKEPCHGIAIDERYRDVKVLEVCTSPKNHPKQFVPRGGRDASGARKTGGLTDKEKAARRAKREHTKAIREAEAERWAILEAMFAKPIALKHRDVALRFAAEAWLNRESGTSWSHVGDSARRLLDLSRTSSQYSDRDPLKVALAKAKDPADVLRISLAIGIGFYEDGIRLDVGSGWSGAWTRCRPYFAFLEAIGYKASASERLAISGKAPA